MPFLLLLSAILSTASASNDDALAAVRAHVSGLAGSAVAPAWDRAQVDTSAVQTLHPSHLDVPLVDSHTQRSLGHVVVQQAAPHAVVSWSTEGLSPTQSLLEEHEAATKFYRLDAVTFAAEDASGKLLAGTGALRIGFPVKAAPPLLDDATSPVLLETAAKERRTAPRIYQNWAELKADTAEPSSNLLELQGSGDKEAKTQSQIGKLAAGKIWSTRGTMHRDKPNYNNAASLQSLWLKVIYYFYDTPEDGGPT